MTSKPKRKRSPYYHWRVRELLPEMWDRLKDEPPLVVYLLAHELLYLDRTRHLDEPETRQKNRPRTMRGLSSRRRVLG